MPTPEWLFLSTGIRAVDHAVEDICSINGQPLSEGAAFHALRLLGSGLPAVKADAADLDARLDCQIGAWMSMVGSQTGVSKGASHGIGHVLGRHRRCAARLHLMHHAAARVALQLRSTPTSRRGSVRRSAIRARQPPISSPRLIAGLGLPTRLRDVGVKREQLDLIAAELDARPLDSHQPAQDRRTGGRFAPCSTRPGRQPGHRDIDHEGRGEGRGTQGEQHPIGAAGVGKDVGEAVGRGRLAEREGGRAQTPRPSFADPRRAETR